MFLRCRPVHFSVLATKQPPGSSAEASEDPQSNLARGVIVVTEGEARNVYQVDVAAAQAFMKVGRS